MKFTTRLASGKKKGQTATCRGRINKSGQLVAVKCTTNTVKRKKKTTRRRRRRRVA